jgi:RNA polymerase sigma factor (TIGR02999 family)
MSGPSATDDTVTILRSAGDGDEQAAGILLERVYDHLHAIASGFFRQQRSDHTLQPTAVVHEAFLKLVGAEAADWNDRAHFIAVAARAMRQVLVDHARSKGTLKRGGHRRRVQLDDASPAGGGPAVIDIVALDEALDQLAALDPRQARVVELRFIGGLTVAEAAAVLDVSPRTVELDWRMARAWLSQALGEDR